MVEAVGHGEDLLDDSTLLVRFRKRFLRTRGSGTTGKVRTLRT
jgi:hypothetical protein